MRKGIVLFLVILSMSAAGCATSETDPDQAAITQTIDSSGLFAQDFTDGAGTLEASSLGMVEPSSLPLTVESLAAVEGTLVFWRRGDILPAGREVEIYIAGDIAIAKVVRRFAGFLHVVRIIQGNIQPWLKPFHDTSTRYARFHRIPAGWVLTHVSPVEMAMADTSRQTVHITGVKASVGNTLVWEAASPSQLFTAPTGLAVFDSHDRVLVETSIEDLSGWGNPLVFLHRPGLGPWGRVRDPMFDDGTHGDKIAGDWTYSRAYTVGVIPGIRHAAVDVLDGATLSQEAASYNSGAWGMPYLAR